MLIILLLLVSSFCAGMSQTKDLEPVKEATGQHLIFTNETSWNLLILFTRAKYQSPAGASLIPGGEVILQDAGEMSSIIIVPSGKCYGKTQLSEPANLKKQLEECSEKEHYEIAISAPTSCLQYMVPFSYALLPYPEIKLRHKLGIPKRPCLADAFPEAAAALAHDKLPFARHYLGISLSSSHITDYHPSLYEAYERKIKRWQPFEKNYRTFVIKVVQLLNHAYSLISEEQTLHELLKGYDIKLPLTIKDYAKGTMGDDIVAAHHKLSQKWVAVRDKIPPALHTKIINHMASEYELLECRSNLNKPVEELPSEYPLSPEQQEVLRILLDPELLTRKN